MAKSNEPLICTTNSRYHIDYGIPLVANKSTDYRTTTGSCHDGLPPNPDDFDCRVKVNLRDDWRFTDVALKNSTFASTNRNDFVTKYTQTRVCDSYRKAPRKNKDYTRNIEESMFAHPPRPITPKISEMKDNFRINYLNLDSREVIPPAISAVCPVQGLGRDEQPPVRPENPGFWKWLDPYMTTNKSTHIQFNKTQCKNAKKDFPTYYNTNGKWPGFDETLPPASGNKSVIDHVPFKHQFPNRNLPKIVHRVPHSGITTEYSSNYQINSKSDLAPYIQAPGEEFPESLSGSSAWQNLAAPGMYCTEYCQLGTTKSARNIIAIDKPKSTIVHKPCRFKLTDAYRY
ncbi:uncharacterized protein LOC123308320 [Coccinella septempunctata]|uniref:uncharacterized protein LOC123308320 n=1 Tax=Coccinella septempunctata TaxID=41139 RepID=UPI001D07E350|nr:uncharacterized protein LOC123308320 [Coccinella septempunctata]